jgi:uncharacterized membrane protein YhaH (DUF805 family)
VLESKENAMNFRQLATINGRATRTDFLTISAVFFAVTLIFIWTEPWWDQPIHDTEPLISAAKLAIIFLSGLSMLVFAWLSFATTVRRLHDMNRSGWWYLLGSAPMINAVLLVLLVFMPPIDINDYGSDPRAKRKPKASLAG